MNIVSKLSDIDLSSRNMRFIVPDKKYKRGDFIEIKSKQIIRYFNEEPCIVNVVNSKALVLQSYFYINLSFEDLCFLQCAYEVLWDNKKTILIQTNNEKSRNNDYYFSCFIEYVSPINKFFIKINNVRRDWRNIINETQRF